MKNTTLRSASMLLACAFCMCTISMGAAIPKIHQAFPNVSLSVIQMSMNFAGICAAVMSMSQSWIQYHFDRRTIILTGLSVFVLAGIGAMFFHGNIWILFLWTGMMGVGTGLYYALISRILTEDCPEEKRGGILAIQNAMNSLGGVVMSLLGGILVALWWPACYAVNLMALPVLVLCIMVLPKQSSKSKDDTERGPIAWGFVLKYFLVVFSFAMVYFIANSNISVLIEEKKIGDAALSGAGSATLMLGGMSAGFLYNSFYRHLKQNTAIIGILLAGVGFFVMVISNNPIILLLGAFLTGGSFSLVNPFFLDIVTRKANRYTIGTALGVVGTCSGAVASFLSPLLFTGVGGVLGITTAADRMIAGIVCCGILAMLHVFFKSSKGCAIYEHE